MNKSNISPETVARFHDVATQVQAHAKQPFSRWLPLKDDIALLRQRGLSYAAISGLLTQNNITASPAGIMRFCRIILKEERSRKPSAKQTRPRRKNVSSPPENTPDTSAQTTPPTTTPYTPTPFGTPPQEGSVIAKLELLPPEEKTTSNLTPTDTKPTPTSATTPTPPAALVKSEPLTILHNPSPFGVLRRGPRIAKVEHLPPEEIIHPNTSSPSATTETKEYPKL